VLVALIDVLDSLSPEEWRRPTACGSWDVKDVALHLLGDEVGNLSRRRDGFAPGGSVAGWPELVALVDRLNEQWVEAGRRMSTRLVRDLLECVGQQACDYFASLDPLAIGGPVSWAGPQPAPVWLDVAREYTERWLHQQHIRDAVETPGLLQPRYLHPVLATFVHALPRTYQSVEGPEGTLVSLKITGPAGGEWFLRREAGTWALRVVASRSADARIALPQGVAWRMFTRGLGRDDALAALSVDGDRELALRILDAVSIIA
jgi:uncharacterized protein (TIGR03083 family)